MVAAPGRFTAVEEVLERARGLVERLRGGGARAPAGGRGALRRARPRRPRHRRDGRPVRGADRLPASAGASSARSPSAWTSPTASPPSGPRTTARSRPPSAPRACSSPSSASTWPSSRSRRRRGASTWGRAGSSSTRGRRASSSNDQRLEPVFALAAERRVPILIHGGRGLPPIADHLRRLHDAYPEASLIIAHAGIADLAALSECFAGRPRVYFDTSVWSAIDLLDMFARVSPGQVLYASDYPYGQQPGSLLLALRTAMQRRALGGRGPRHARPLGGAHRRRRAAGPARRATRLRAASTSR